MCACRAETDKHGSEAIGKKVQKNNKVCYLSTQKLGIKDELILSPRTEIWSESAKERRHTAIS